MGIHNTLCISPRLTYIVSSPLLSMRGIDPSSGMKNIFSQMLEVPVETIFKCQLPVGIAVVEKSHLRQVRSLFWGGQCPMTNQHRG